MRALRQLMLSLVFVGLLTGCAGLKSTWDTVARETVRAIPLIACVVFLTPYGPVVLIVSVVAVNAATNAVVENAELRSGGLKGEEALNKEIDRLTEELAEANGRPPQVRTVVQTEWEIPWRWIFIGAFLYHLVSKGHHIINAIRTEGKERRDSILKFFLLKRTVVPKTEKKPKQPRATKPEHPL